MIDYLEDLLEEETAVELPGDLVVPGGPRSGPSWEEDEAPLRTGRSLKGDAPEEEIVLQEGEPLASADRPSWVEGTELPRTGAAELLTALTRTARTAGMVRQQGSPLTVTLTGETPQGGSLDLATLDRAVQRDARRYDGGFPLY
ncbi:MAG: hypothetical protein J6K94_01285 [Ruminiclostridium sp.]|nr:hypothetical protein [Ruminiclostridium sp.]